LATERGGSKFLTPCGGSTSISMIAWEGTYDSWTNKALSLKVIIEILV
jgi:hypothetical protein